MSNFGNNNTSFYKKVASHSRIPSVQKKGEQLQNRFQIKERSIIQTPKQSHSKKQPFVYNQDTEDSRYESYRIGQNSNEKKSLIKTKNKSVRFNPDLSFCDEQFTSSKQIHQMKKPYGQIIPKTHQQIRPKSNQYYHENKNKPKNFEDEFNMKNNLINHKTNINMFESARIDSIKCLNNLSGKLKEEIDGIQCKLQSFNNRMYRIINIEFKKLKDTINQTVEKVFRQNEKNINKYMKVQQSILASELLQAKQNLQNQYQKIQNMKQQINKGGWRKVAGQLIANDIVDKIQVTIQDMKTIQIGYWQSLDLGNLKLKQFEQELKEMIRIAK